MIAPTDILICPFCDRELARVKATFDPEHALLDERIANHVRRSHPVRWRLNSRWRAALRWQSVRRG